MKKFLAVLMATMMILSTSVVAFGATLTENNTTGDVLVKTSIYKDGDGGNVSGENFTVEIPATTVIPWLSNDSVDVGFTVTAQLLVQNKISVSVSGSADSKLVTADGTYSLPYAITGTTNYKSAGPVVTAERNDLALSVTNWAGVPVAEYSDVLTYAVSVGE